MMDYFDGEHGSIHLLVVGDGELRSLVQKRVWSRGDTTWLPYCDNSERLAELYSAADLFVHAGTCETFGMVSLEAQACGTRVLAVRGGGLDETLTGEEPMIMAEDARACSLAEGVKRIRRLGQTEEQRHKRRQRVVNNFCWLRTYERLCALYQHLCERKALESFTREPRQAADAVYRPALLTE
jgi:alpha-1,6-mannosyltransferase